MTDYIKREDALRILENGDYWPIGKLEDDILHLPDEDVALVIRCKDCKYFLPYLTGCETTVEKADGNCGLLVLGDVQFTARQINDFCSYGELKEANNG